MFGARYAWSKVKKIKLIEKNVENHMMKIVGNTIENLIQVKLDADSKNHNFKIKLILFN